MRPIVFVFYILICFPCRADEPIRILAWNIESGGSDTSIIIDQLKTEMPAYDVVALSEVPSNAIQPIANALGWQHLGGSRGGEDRLMLAWSKRFRATDQIELRSVSNNNFPAGGSRAPIITRLIDSKTGIAFCIMNNHLTRGNEKTVTSKLDFWLTGSRVSMIQL